MEQTTTPTSTPAPSRTVSVTRTVEPSQSTASTATPSKQAKSTNKTTSPQTQPATSSSNDSTSSSKNSPASLDFSISAKPLDGEKAATRPEYLPEKFWDGKTNQARVEELAKSYAELEKRAAKTQAATAVPDDYDFDGAVKEAGLVLNTTNAATDEAKQAIAAFKAELKEDGFTQKQVNKMLKLHKQWGEELVAKYGPNVDVEQERTSLQAAWGNEAQQKYEAVKTWAGAQMDTSLLTKPLLATAKGIQYLEQLMKQQSGPTPVTESNNVALNSSDALAEARAQFQELMRRPDYTSKAVQQMADTLIAKITKLSAQK